MPYSVGARSKAGILRSNLAVLRFSYGFGGLQFNVEFYFRLFLLVITASLVQSLCARKQLVLGLPSLFLNVLLCSV